MKIHIKNGRLLSHAIDTISDIFIVDKTIVAHEHAPDNFVADQTIDATNQWIIPGLIDIGLQLSLSSDITAMAQLARQAGISALCCWPDIISSNTKLPTRIFPVGALTQDFKGQQLSAMSTLKEAGCVALSNGRSPIVDTTILRHAFDYAATFDLPIIYYPNDPYLSQGCVHEGQASLRLGLPGIPATAETIDLARVLLLQQETGVRLHIARLSTARGVEMMAQAKTMSAKLSCDVAIHHLFLTEQDVLDFTAACYVQPPLRSLSDQKALIEGVRTGVIDIICSDHQDISLTDKCAPFAQTKPGIYGLPTLLPLILELASHHKITLTRLMDAVCYRPAQLIHQQPPLGTLGGTLAVNSCADLNIIDPQAPWDIPVDPGLNPFSAWPLLGKINTRL